MGEEFCASNGGQDDDRRRNQRANGGKLKSQRRSDKELTEQADDVPS
jgi:hypothetical protein